MFNRPIQCLVVAPVLMFAGCFIQGKVVDENGEGVACITVSLSGDETRTTTTNSEGKYRFGDVFTFDYIFAGSYTVTPSKSGYSFTPASTDVTITNQPFPDTDYYVPWFVSDVDFLVMTEVHGDVYRMCGTSVGLRWNPTAGATGYKIYYNLDNLPIGTGPPYNGIEAAEGDSPVDVGNETACALNFARTGDIRFAVTAYNQWGESAYSVEVGCPGWRQMAGCQDLSSFAASFGSISSDMQCDYNGDEDVDGSELANFLGGFE